MWYLYIVRCSDDSLYTGITTNINERIEKHNSSKGSKSLKGKLPVRLVHKEFFFDRSSASKREWEVKKLSRSEKISLIENGPIAHLINKA